MKSSLKYVLVLMLIAVVSAAIYYFIYTPHNHSPEANTNEIYTCPMHPEIIRNEPGSCPICGMTLVKKTVSHQDSEPTSVNSLLKRTDKFIVGNFEKTTPIDTAMGTVLDLPGYIEYDPNQSVAISARVSGRIEKMFVNYTFQKISKGQKLFEVYSPELLNEQQNFIYLLTNDAENTSIINASKQKLLLYGMTSAQIAELVNKKRTNPLIAIYSPVNGIVKGSGQMEKTPSQPMQSNVGPGNLTVKEGNYIQKGVTVFQLVSTDKVWGIFNILPGYNSLVKVNRPLVFTTEFDSRTKINAKVDFVETELIGTNKSNRIRVYINNSNHFPIGLRLQAQIKTDAVPGIWIQKESQVSIGTEKVVFVKEGNGFLARKVSLGQTMGNYVQVIGGIKTSDTIAKNAQYLIDSESFIKTE